MTAIKIQSCKECRDCDISRDPTADSFEYCEKWICSQIEDGKNNEIVRYKDWNEKDPKVPKWCPKR